MAEPVIETSRLLMRPPHACDLDGWAAFAADAQPMRFLGGVQPRSVAWRGMAMSAGSWSLQGFGVFSVILRDSGAWIGRVGPRGRDRGDLVRLRSSRLGVGRWGIECL